MLGRRILRIKAFKTIYAYAVTGKMTQAEAAEQFKASCEAVRYLYLFMLSSVPYITAEARSRIEAAKGKLNPSAEDLNPNEKFAGNALAVLLENDPDFNKILERKKLSWTPYDILIRNIFDSISGKDYYKRYMEAPGTSLAEDCKLFTKIFEQEFVDNEALEPVLEEISLLWVDDLAYALTWCCHSVDDLAAGKPWRLPELYQSDQILRDRPEAKVDSDKDFATKLVRCALAGYEKYFEKVVSMVPGWDKDRLFSSDMAVIACAMAEIENFKDIPAKVSLNEYVEISKFYCSPKSRSFINGVLDRLIKENNLI
ncbi:MAG: transcription antitermination protein NusB [Bacteroidales bacterium]|nr:transcription antitermination protein NusB [Bacteroidales bacterium]